MIKYIQLLSIVALFSMCQANGQQKKESGYQFDFQVTGAAKDSVAYLANYFGKQLYYNDTAIIGDNGKFTFKKQRDVEPGKYAVVLKNNGIKFFEIIVDESRMSMKTDTTDLINNMVVEQSENNVIFYDYVKFLNQKKTEASEIREKREAEEKEKAKEKLTEALIAIDKEVKEYQQEIVDDHGDLLIGQIVNMNLEVVIPDPPKKDDGTIDSAWQYYYYRDHYFDRINLQNDALVRTPSFHNKLVNYFDKVLLQHPDTICTYVGKLSSQVEPLSDMFKYVVNTAINHFNQSKIMGMDGVFVCLGEQYYMSGKAYWADSATVAKIAEKVQKLSPILIGKKAPYINLPDYPAKKMVNLYAVDATYVALVFWDSGCGHCKKELPKLQEIYEKFGGKDFEVYAVGTELERDEWEKYIDEKGYNKWINVSDTPETPHPFRTLYDIYATPKIFLLDKDKKIIAKQIGVEQLGEILEGELNKL